MLQYCRRDVRGVAAHASALTALSNEHALGMWLAYATMASGWALVRRCRAKAGLEQLRNGLARLQATGTRLFAPYGLGLLAEAHQVSGDAEEARRMLDEALALVEGTGERWIEAELLRLKGEMKLMVGGPAAAGEAEICFHQALDVARAQGANSWELRTATSLARLWRDEGRSAEAHDLLPPVYGWFTEGFDTADLKNAHYAIRSSIFGERLVSGHA
jgi:predicted ATPase